MYYYKKEDNEIIKYQVFLEEESLKKLRSEMIERCSLITHKCYRTTQTPNKFDYEHIKNYHEKKIGIIEYNDFYSMPEDEYLVEYDYYEHPLLVSLIDRLIKGETNVIDEIEKYKVGNIDYEQILLQEQQEIINKLSNINYEKINEQIELLNKNKEKLLNYQKQKILNKNQISANNYIPIVFSCIKQTKIASIPLNSILDVQIFFENSNNVNIENRLNKLLKLSKETNK